MIVEKIKDDRFPDDSFFVFSPSGIEILKNIHIAGDPFRALNFYTSYNFLQAAYSNTSLNAYSKDEIACLSVLRSGPHYYVSEAYNYLTRSRLPSVTIGAKRKKVGNSMATEIYSENLSLLGKGIKCLITSEIIASGSTLKAVFDHVASNYNIKEWNIFSIAAAEKGCRKLKDLERKHNIKVNLFVNSFIGGLGQNDTDIPFYHPDAIMPAGIESMLRGYYGEELFEKIPCCIGDGGDRLLDPKKHYEEFLKIYSSINVQKEKSSRVLQRMIKEVEEKLRK